MRIPPGRLRRTCVVMVCGVCSVLVVACGGPASPSPPVDGHNAAGFGPGRPAHMSADAVQTFTTAAQPADAPTDTADTRTLLSLEDRDGTVISTTFTLRDGVVSMAPDAALPVPDMITVDAARTSTADQNYGAGSRPISCVMGDLSDTDLLQKSSDHTRHLSTATPVWMCFQVKVPGSASLGSARPSNVVTFINPVDGSELFTIEDGSLSE